jgi:hypothetical protein
LPPKITPLGRKASALPVVASIAALGITNAEPFSANSERGVIILTSSVAALDG